MPVDNTTAVLAQSIALMLNACQDVIEAFAEFDKVAKTGKAHEIAEFERFHEFQMRVIQLDVAMGAYKGFNSIISEAQTGKTNGSVTH